MTIHQTLSGEAPPTAKPDHAVVRTPHRVKGGPDSASGSPAQLRPNVDLRCYVDVPPFRVMSIREALTPRRPRLATPEEIAGIRSLAKYRAARQRAKWGLK